MRFDFGALSCASLVFLFGVVAAIENNITYIPDAYIVELEPQMKISSVSLPPLVSTNGKHIGYNVRRKFNTKHFNGLSLTVTDGTSLSSLRETKGVKNAWKVRFIPRPDHFHAAPLAPLAARDQETLPHVTGESDVNNPLKMTNVKRLHDIGIKGQGVKVAVIDSGVDYLHPSLGGGFGPGYKIAFGYVSQTLGFEMARSSCMQK
jgi:subtilisin family serine protease